MIIFIALSSALYVILRDRRLGLITILIIYILYSVGVGLPDIMYRDDTHLYYLLGAYAGLHCQVEQIKKLNSRKMFVIGVLGLLLSMICWDFWIKVVALSIYAVGMTVGYCNLVQKTPFSHETSEVFAANTFVYYSHFFFIGGIKKLIGIIFGKLSLDGILWCSIAFCLSTLACIIVILYLRKVLHAIINKVGNDRLKKMTVILIP